ncbi:DMT family transporter [Bifidobacterium aquikefiricola]|uniref:DMT family transporter n=1 Tax=Bifidobacterium aquikefiricola TaxID=3059038 RepID=A0AB39U7E5_9BIFI
MQAKQTAPLSTSETTADRGSDKAYSCAQHHSSVFGRFSGVIPHVMLLGAAAIWGSTYAVSKSAMEVISPQWLLAIRTLLGALILGLVCRHRLHAVCNRRTMMMAVGVAVVYYIAFLAQMKGLTLISPGRSAFLSALYCVIIPLIQWGMRHRAPGLHHIVAAVLCLIGVGCVAHDSAAAGSGMSVLGDALTIACAVAFAVYFYALGSLSATIDAMALTFVIFLVSGVLFLIGALFTEPFPTHIAQQHTWIAVLYLVCAAVGAQVLQNLGLARTSAMEASIVLSTDTVFALVISVIWFAERPSGIALIGFACIFLAVLLAVTMERFVRN